jgi:cell division protein WhiA
VLSEDVRAELAAIEPRKPCCRLAELSALIRGAGSVHLRGGGRIAIHLDVASPAVARRVFRLLKRYGVPCEIHTFRRRAFERARRFRILIEDEARALQALNEMGVLDVRLAPLEHPPRRVVARPCCRAAYLRGALLGAGSVSGPKNAHLELRTATLEGARFLAALGREESFGLAVHDRGRHSIAYLKGREAIAELLAFLGAQGAALRLGESAVVAATKARANRLANADHANIVRTSRAADAQLRAIRRLEAAGRLEQLPVALREVAELRTRYPSLSLRELARRLRPPATKAAAHRRLAKLQKLAER